MGMVRPPYWNVYWACALVRLIASNRPAIARHFFIVATSRAGNPFPPPLLRSNSFTQRDPDHFPSISRVLAALVQIRLGILLGSLNSVQWTVNFLRKQAYATQESIEPGCVDFPEAAVLSCDVQPLIDKGFQRDVALQPIGLLGK